MLAIQELGWLRQEDHPKFEASLATYRVKPSLKIKNNNKKAGGRKLVGDVAQLAECLPCIDKALGWIPSARFYSSVCMTSILGDEDKMF